MGPRAMRTNAPTLWRSPDTDMANGRIMEFSLNNWSSNLETEHPGRAVNDVYLQGGISLASIHDGRK